jgi:hypothetical protein
VAVPRRRLQRRTARRSKTLSLGTFGRVYALVRQTRCKDRMMFMRKLCRSVLVCLSIVSGSTVVRGSAASRIPSFDIQAACRALVLVPDARLSGNAARDCLRDERRARSRLSTEWSQFAPADKRVCVGLSRQGDVDPVYTGLLSCLEMARAARQPVSVRPDLSSRGRLAPAWPDGRRGTGSRRT